MQAYKTHYKRKGLQKRSFIEIYIENPLEIAIEFFFFLLDTG